MRGSRCGGSTGSASTSSSATYITREFVSLVRTRLAPEGIYLLNLVDAFPDPLLVKSVVKTLREQFDHVHVWTGEPPGEPARITYIVSATDRSEPPVRLAAQRGFERRWVRVVGRLLTTELGR